jgi:trimeric autotransporter adhesin
MFKSSIQKSVFLSLLCLTSMGYADSQELAWQTSSQQQKNSQPCGRGPKHMRVSARHIEGKGIGYNQGYTTLEAFLAPDEERFSIMPFLDLRGHVFDNGKFAANAGIGARGRWGCRAYGINAYYDYRNSKKNYNQVSLGLESLGEIWDFRINGYLPIGSKVSRPYHTRFSHFSGNNLILSRKYECTMKGADAEAGGHFYSGDFDFFGGAGPYYFDGEIGPHAWGGKARLFGMWKEYIGLQVSYSYDNVFRSIVQGEITFSVPFGPRPKVKDDRKHCQTTCRAAERLDRRMVQPVVRDEIIVLNDPRKNSVAINPLTGDPFRFFFVNNTSHSAGTFESPFNTLADAQKASGPGDVIYVFPGDMTNTGMSSGITLQDGQQLLGATTSQTVATTAGSVTIKPQASGIFLPLLTNGSGNVVTLANNNVVSGFFIQNLTGHGIYGSAINNATATQNIILSSQSTYNGIELDNATGIATLSNNTLLYQNYYIYINNSLPVSNATYALTNNIIDNNATMYAVLVSLVEGSNNSLIFSGNQIQGSSNTGLQINCSNTVPNAAHTFTISNNQIQAANVPFYIGSSGTVSNLTMNGNSFYSGSSYGNTISVTNGSTLTATLNGNFFGGIYYLVNVYVQDTSTASFDFNGNTFHDYEDDVLLYLSTSGSANLTALNFANNTCISGYGIYIETDSSSSAPTSISCTNNTFIAQDVGITVLNSGANAISMDVSGNLFQGFISNAIYIDSDGGTTCLELNNNQTNQYPNAYLLQQSVGGIFNLQTPTGNQGQVVEMGTITPVTSCQ